jgi:hypothetical protein
MNYIGNYKEIIPAKLIAYLSANKGLPRPKTSPVNLINKTTGYELTNTYWHIFENQHIPWSIHTPWTTGRVHWWITKLVPGDIMPMHKDPQTVNTNCARYWIPLQDYVEGHVFIISNNLMTDYKAGDVYAYKFSEEVHGAANISYNPRYVLQVIEFF